MIRARTRRACRGFTYLTVLFMVAMLGTGLALIGEVWETSAKREREAELLFVGHEYRKAIERYVLAGPRQYPRALEDLLKDRRQPSTQRYLRKLYPDPITGQAEWGLVKAPDGGILGVYSLSAERPLKISNFKLHDRQLEGAASYTDWKFVYQPAAQGAATKPAAATPAAK